MKTPAAVRFVSLEPLLADVGDLSPWLLPRWTPVDAEWSETRCLDWVIVGGESGAGARPFKVQWARSILQQCKAAGVAAFMKQLGANVADDDLEPPRVNPETGARTLKVRQVIDINDRKGGDPLEWPEDLRVREMPEAVRA